MLSLNHVCIWRGKKWERIKAGEVAKEQGYPGGSISAHSRLFMCELCGQYVTFVQGKRQIPHFRHKSEKESRNCPERTKSIEIIRYSDEEHELPVRLLVDGQKIRFQLGLLRIPEGYIDRDSKITIKLSESLGNSYVYAAERILPDRITYLDVGNMPGEKYSLEVLNCRNNEIYKFWPKENKGIRSGAVFDKASGLKLPEDADVTIGRGYYLLNRGYNNEYPVNVVIKELLTIGTGMNQWRLYDVSASEYSSSAAEFFLKYRCRLTDSPVELRALWPAFVEGEYVLKHNRANMFIMAIGSKDIHVYPGIKNGSYPGQGYVVNEIQCRGRQALLSVGRMNPLRYTYFWREELNDETQAQAVSVTDGSGTEIEEGVINELPKDRRLRIRLPFDGTIIVRAKGRIKDKISAAAEKINVLNDISYGMEITITVGLDVCRHTVFERKKRTAAFDEQEMLNVLKNAKGAVMPVPHTLGGAAAALAQYPMIRHWLYERIRQGNISRQAYRYLQRMLLHNTDKRGK